MGEELESIPYDRSISAGWTRQPHGAAWPSDGPTTVTRTTGRPHRGHAGGVQESDGWFDPLAFGGDSPLIVGHRCSVIVGFGWWLEYEARIACEPLVECDTRIVRDVYVSVEAMQSWL